jgi:hypothetical protein
MALSAFYQHILESIDGAPDSTLVPECWELDALDPNVLRSCVENKITDLIDADAWERCAIVNRAEQKSLREILSNWASPAY